MIIHPYNSVTEGEPGLRGSPIYQEGGGTKGVGVYNSSFESAHPVCLPSCPLLPVTLCCHAFVHPTACK